MKGISKHTFVLAILAAPWWELVQAGVIGKDQGPEGRGHVTGGVRGAKLVPVEHVLGERICSPHRVALFIHPKGHAFTEIHHMLMFLNLEYSEEMNSSGKRSSP